MNDLHTWLSQQHHGLRTFRTFQQKLDDARQRDDPGQRGHVPAVEAASSVAMSRPSTRNRCPSRSRTAPINACLTLVASLDLRRKCRPAAGRFNRVAALDLRH